MKHAKPFSMKEIFKSIFYPTRSGEEAAAEYIGLHNRVKTKEEIEDDFKRLFKPLPKIDPNLIQYQNKKD